MQQQHNFNTETAQSVGQTVAQMVPILLLSSTKDTQLEAQLRRLGGQVEVATEFYTGLAALLDDPKGYGLVVMDCDSMGGDSAGARLTAALTAEGMTLPRVLISQTTQVQSFPDQSDAPVELRGPATGLSLRIGCEHALRHRLMWQARQTAATAA